MSTKVSLKRRALVTACAATGTTERAARRWGAGVFLPALFTQRYANMASLDEGHFRAQMAACRSFDDEGWCRYWNDIATSELGRVAPDLRALGIDLAADQDATLSDPDSVTALARAVAPYATLLADHALQPPAEALAHFSREEPDAAIAAGAEPVSRLVGALLRAITYLQVSAFPGGTPHRLRAYRRSRRLFDALAAAVAVGLETTVEQVAITVGADIVHAYRCLPPGGGRSPMVIVTNGLEGTVQELLVPLLRYHAAGIGVLVMEMPGSYAYASPMSPASEAVYRAVIDTVITDPRVDPSRVGIVGVSFGGYWAARMAAVDDRLRCAVACGAPTDHSFRPKLGLPEIIIDALGDVTGARNPISLLRRLRALSLRNQYAEITQPLLVINGDRDTLLSTRDSIDLAAGAPNAELLLYGGDDHCAMGHYRDWLDKSQVWLAHHLREQDTQ